MVKCIKNQIHIELLKANEWAASLHRALCGSRSYTIRTVE